MNILVVEDDIANAKLVKKLLEVEHYKVDLAQSYAQGLEAVENYRYDLIVLDWNLPDESGLKLLQELRSLLIESQVLMLSANADVDYRVEALNNGADDYLCKPYSHLELIARINSLLRRNNSNKNMTLQLGTIFIDKLNQIIKNGEDTINLTQAEYIIFTSLAFNPNKIFTKFELLDLIHNDYTTSSMSNIIEVHIKNIRKKMANKEIIQTVRGVGYRLKRD